MSEVLNRPNVVVYATSFEDIHSAQEISSTPNQANLHESSTVMQGVAVSAMLLIAGAATIANRILNPKNK